MDELLNTLNDAVARGDWLTVGVGAVVVLTSLVGAGLKMAGKSVPVLDQVANIAKAALKMLPKKEPVQPKPDEKQGVEAVVEVRNEKGPQP